jgi:hypothetical protein
MEKSTNPRLEFTLSTLRDLVNKLSVISGHCDLLSDDLKAGSQCAKRVGAIQEITREVAEELNEYQRRLLESARTAAGQKRGAA